MVGTHSISGFGASTGSHFSRFPPERHPGPSGPATHRVQRAARHPRAERTPYASSPVAPARRLAPARRISRRRPGPDTRELREARHRARSRSRSAGRGPGDGPAGRRRRNASARVQRAQAVSAETASGLIRLLLRPTGGAQRSRRVPGTSSHCKCLHNCIGLGHGILRRRLRSGQLAEVQQAWRIPGGNRGYFRGNAGRHGRPSSPRAAHARDRQDAVRPLRRPGVHAADDPQQDAHPADQRPVQAQEGGRSL